MKILVHHSAFFALIGLILSPLVMAHASSSQADCALCGFLGSEEVTPSEKQASEYAKSVETATTDANGRAASTLTLGSNPGTNTVEVTVDGLDPATFTAVGQAIHNIMLKVEYVERDRVTFASFVPTWDIRLRASEFLKYYEVVIWEETSSVHFYEFPNDFDRYYGYDITSVDGDGFPLGYNRNDITDEQKIAYREQFLISKYTDMPTAWTDERSTFLKSVFMDIASYLVDRHPESEHHLKFRGHGGPGGRLFSGHLARDHAYEFLEFWSQSLGRPLGVIDMGGPCNKGSLADLDNFCDSARYYIASDLLNGGYSMDEFTWAKREEVWPLTQYHNLFFANQNLEEALKGRIDLKRKDYEYSRNNMIDNRVAQGNYLYSCETFRRFSPNFKAFLGSTGVDYRIFDDLYQYMIDNNAPSTLIEQFNDVFVYKADNKDFFEWSEVSNGMLMPDPGLLFLPPRPRTLDKLSGDEQQGPAGAALAAPFIVSVLDQNGSAFAGAVVSFSVTAGGGMLSSTTATTDANGRARSTLTLGSDPGTNTVAATVAGLGTVTFTTTAVEQTPHSLTKVSGDSQEGPASTQLNAPFVVSVLDQDGEAFAGVSVTFSVTAGEGMLSSTTDTNPCTVEPSTSSTTATTDANGRAATRLTLGSDAGTNTVSATVEGLEPVTFTATAAEQAMPHSLAKVCGEDQEGTAGILLAEPFVVSVLDEDSAAIAGVVVSFSVTAGGGTLSSATATTDANGRAATRLTLGSDAGTNTVSATAEGLESVTFTATGQESPFVSLFDLFGGGKRVALPDSPQLAQNAPNPFNSQTVLAYFLHAPSPASVEVFALTGQRVAVLQQGLQQAGYHRLRWDGRDDAGRPVASGMYLYRLMTEETVLTRKLILLR